MKIYILAAILYSMGMQYGLGQFGMRGVVIDQKGQKMHGVSIVVIGEGRVDQTDQDGKFYLTDLSVGDSVLFSSIGYRDTVIYPAGTDMSITVRMYPDAQQIDEIEVFTGYQQIPKERATGSFEGISAEKLGNIVGPNILDRLEGQTSMLFDRGTDRPVMTLRGINTFEGNTAPLIILDNFPYDGSIESINPIDVEHITFLKDAAASSIWGARASNGVIVITTKKRAKGSGPAFSFSSTLQTAAKPDLHYIRQMDSKSLVELERTMFNEGIFRFYEDDPAKPFLSPVIESLIEHRDGLISDLVLEDRLSRFSEIDNRKQYLDYMYRNPLLQNYHLSAANTRETSSYYVSLGMDNNADNLHARFQRYTVLSRYMKKVGDRVEINGTLQFYKLHNRNGATGYPEQGYHYRPYMNLIDEDGQEIGHYQLSRGYVDQMYADGMLLDWRLFPLQERDANRRLSHDMGVVLSADMRWKVFKGLRIDMLYRYEGSRNNTLQDRTVDSYFARNTINTYTSFDNGVPQLNIPYGGMRIDRNTVSNSHNWRGQANLDQSWGMHNLSGIGGMEIRSVDIGSVQQGLYGFDEENLSIARVDYLAQYRHLLYGTNQTIPYHDYVRGSRRNFVSGYLNVGYDYGSRYLVSASARRDASNNLGLATNQRWNPMYSLGLGWNVHRESFWKGELFESLKFRTTFGLTGNIDPSKSAVAVLTYLSSQDNLSRMPRAAITSNADNALRWETTKIWNAGLDFVLAPFNTRGRIEYYQKWNEDLFAPSINDVTNGAGTSLIRNVGNIESKGVEVGLLMDWLKSRDFALSSHFNYNYNEHIVTSYYQRVDRLSRNNHNNGTYLYRIREGRYLYPIVSYPFLGLDAEGDMLTSLFGEQTKDYNAVRDADLDNLIYSGSAIPLHFGNMGLTARYKRFQLDAILNWKANYYFRRPSFNNTSILRQEFLGAGTADYALRWQNPGDEQHTTVPRFAYPVLGSDALYTVSEATVEPGDHLRMQNLNVSYTQPIAIRGNMYNLRMSAMLSNLGILWRKTASGLDPDFASSIPNPRTYALNIQLNF